MSVTNHFLFRFSHTFAVVPLPLKKSQTISFSLVHAFITLSRSWVEFSVGYPVENE